MPDAGSAPDHAPLAVQLVPVLDDHVKVAACPSTMLVGLTVKDTAGGGFIEPPPEPPPHAPSARLNMHATALALAPADPDAVLDGNNMSDPLL